MKVDVTINLVYPIKIQNTQPEVTNGITPIFLKEKGFLINVATPLNVSLDT